MKIGLLLFANGLGGIFAFTLSAQTPPTSAPPPVTAAAASPCPKLEIQAPSGRVLKDGQTVVLGANISGGDPNVNPTIVWNLSAGTIMGGQGTRSIQVDTTGAGPMREIVADVWLGGYAGECVVQAATSVKVVGHATKIDEFGDLTPETENERLTNAASAVAQNNDSIYLIAYAGRSNVRGYAVTGLRRMKTYLGSIIRHSDRVGTIDGGFREVPADEAYTDKKDLILDQNSRLDPWELFAEGFCRFFVEFGEKTASSTVITEESEPFRFCQ